jgi:hypothetical protein
MPKPRVGLGSAGFCPVAAELSFNARIRPADIPPPAPPPWLSLGAKQARFLTRLVSAHHAVVERGAASGPLQGVKNRIAEFVRTVVPDKNVAPSHGWRHRFKTVGIEAGIEHRILDAIQGHRPRNVAEGYGEVTIKTQAAAIAKLPRYKVPQ